MHLHKHTYSCSINYSDVKLTTWVWVCALFSLQYWLHFAKQKMLEHTCTGQSLLDAQQMQ